MMITLLNPVAEVSQLDKQFIGKKLKQFRKEQGLTLSEVTKGIMSPATLSFIENGKQEINQKHLAQLLKKLNVPKKVFSVVLLDKTGNETKRELDELQRLVNNMHFDDMAPLINQLDNEPMSRDDRVLFLFLKSLSALNHFNKKMLNTVDDEMKLHYTEDSTDYSYYMYWRFRANYLSFYGDQEASISINKRLLSLDYCPVSPLMYSSTFSGLVRNYILLEDYYKALEFNKKQLSISMISERYEFACDTLLGSAGIFLKLGDIKNQKDALIEGLELAKKLKTPSLLGKALYNFGEFYYLQNEVSKALQCWRESLIYKRNSSEKTTIFTSLRALSEHYIRKNQFEFSHPFILEGMEIAKELNHSRFYYIFKLLNVKYLNETDLADQFIVEAKECEKYYHSTQLERIDSSLQDSDNLKQLYQMLGKYYYKNKKYKKAGEYFSKIDLLDKIPL